MIEHTVLGRGVGAITDEVPEELGPLREHLRELVTLLHWYHLDSWLDELLAEARAPWVPSTPVSQPRIPRFGSTCP